VRVWDIGTRKSLAVQQHTGEVWGVSWRPILAGGGNTFVTGGEEKVVEWWSAPGL
jgi:WD40 repeat protein